MEQAETAFSELIQVFDAEWMLKQRVNGTPPFIHHLANWLLAEGLSPFQSLCSLGLDLHRVREAGLVGNLIRRLKNPQEYWESATFELQLLSHLLSQDFDVESNYKSGKGNCNCDFKISKENETIFLELKRPKDMHGRNEEICNKALNRFLTSLHDGSEIQSLGEPLLSNVELNKIFKNHVLKAVNKQLPFDGAGGIVIESRWALDYWEEFKVMANRRFKNKDKYSHLSFIAVVRSLFNGREDRCRFEHQIKILLNPYARIDTSSSGALQAIHALSD